MVDEKQSPEEEEEYQFSDIESTNVFGTQDAESIAGAEGNPMARNLLIAVGVIAVIFTVYKLMGLYFSPKQKTRSTAKATISKTVSVTQKAPVKEMQIRPIQPITQTPPTTSAVSTESVDKLKNELTVLVRQQNMTNKTELDRVSSSVATIRTELIDMNNNIDQLKKTIAELNTKIADLKTPPKPQVVKRRRPKRVYRGIPHARRTHYIIQAMIPGRAWIKAKNGSTLTISEGSRVPGYGIVREIDPQHGVVITHTGATIKYPPSER